MERYDIMKDHSYQTKTVHHPEKTKKDLTNRLKRIEGQIRGIANMINDDLYCDDILNQISSVESALIGVKKKLLDAHLKSCVVEQIQNGEMEVVEELITTIGRMIK
jgi:DNA-binding FrmR family transcriptional regulator